MRIFSFLKRNKGDSKETGRTNVRLLERKAAEYRARYENGEFDQIVSELTPLLPNLQSDSELRRILSSVHSDRGVAWMKQGQDLTKSLSEFKASVAANPANWRALVNLASVYGDLKQYREALATFEKAIEIHPELRSNSQIMDNVQYLRSVV